MCASPVFTVVQQDRDDPTPLCPPPSLDPPEPDPNIRFGDWLVRRGLITARDLFDVLHDPFLGSRRIGDVLVARGLMQRHQVEEEARAFRTFSAF